MNRYFIAAGIAAIAIIAGLWAWNVRTAQAPTGTQVCTQEAKLCPDGSSVGRTGPHCEFAACPNTADIYTITAADNGKTYSYPVTSRFTLLLDASAYPKSELVCTPSGIIGGISNIPAVSPPLYAARFEAVAPGACTLTDRDFSVHIIVTDGSGGGAGAACGGFIRNAPICAAGYHCQLGTVADKGGVCVAD